MYFISSSTNATDGHYQRAGVSNSDDFADTSIYYENKIDYIWDNGGKKLGSPIGRATENAMRGKENSTRWM
jgi:hypothetical protein